MPAELAYYLVCPEATAERPKIVAFRDWLIEMTGGAPASAAEPG